jgi:glucosamine--fructose-6-phosphate aminotransferase (isomerizing)
MHNFSSEVLHVRHRRRGSATNVTPILLEGLKRLEYRGYDSCGVALHVDGKLQRSRSTSRVAELAAAGGADRLVRLHRHRTRAGPPTAPRPPTMRTRTSRESIALVHNGIIENHDELRAELQAAGYVFESQTDTEVIAHLVDHMYDGDLFDTVQQAVRRLTGAYAIAVFCADEPHRVVARARVRR